MTECGELFIHPLALVEEGAHIGKGSKIWHFCHIRKGAQLGEACILGKGVFVDGGVIIGSRVKIQNNVSIFHGVTIEDGVFIGPHVCFTNDLYPRAITPQGQLKNTSDWKVTQTYVKYGASIGANATIVSGITIGEWSLVGAGAVVTRSVPPYSLVTGSPAKVKGIISPSGEIISRVYGPGVYVSSKGERVEIL